MKSLCFKPIGGLMFYLSVGALGLGLGVAFRWFALPVFGLILAIAMGVEGALHGRSLGTIIVSVFAMLFVLEVAYFLAAWTQEIGLSRWRYRKT